MKAISTLAVVLLVVSTAFGSAPATAASVLEDCTATNPTANAGCTTLFPTPATDCATGDQTVVKVC